MLRVLSASGFIALLALFLATAHAQTGKGPKSVKFMAEIQAVTTGEDHVVQKMKISDLDKKSPYHDLDMRIAKKGKLVYVAADGKTMDFTAKTVMANAAAKKGLKKGKIASITLGGGTTVGGILEVRFGPGVDKAKADKDASK
jgi:hypothetical protein